MSSVSLSNRNSSPDTDREACDAAVGLNFAMAVDNSIGSVKVLVRDTSLPRVCGS